MKLRVRVEPHPAGQITTYAKTRSCVRLCRATVIFFRGRAEEKGEGGREGGRGKIQKKSRVDFSAKLRSEKSCRPRAFRHSSRFSAILTVPFCAMHIKTSVRFVKLTLKLSSPYRLRSQSLTKKTAEKVIQEWLSPLF